jgi:hypothetical protein
METRGEVTVKLTEIEDCDAFVRALPPERKERLAAGEASLDIAFRLACEISKPLCWTAYVSGAPAVMFGCCPASGRPEVGNAWMETTSALDGAKIAFVRQSKKYIKTMTKTYPTIECYAEKGNALLLTWLAWAGFESVDESEGIITCVYRS